MKRVARMPARRSSACLIVSGSSAPPPAMLQVGAASGVGGTPRSSSAVPPAVLTAIAEMSLVWKRRIDRSRNTCTCAEKARVRSPVAW